MISSWNDHEVFHSHDLPTQSHSQSPHVIDQRCPFLWERSLLNLLRRCPLGLSRNLSSEETRDEPKEHLLRSQLSTLIRHRKVKKR